MLTLQQSFLLKFPCNAWYKITVSRNLAGFSFPVANQITGHTDFPWKHFLKTTMWRHTMKKIPWYCKFNVLFIWLKIAPVSAWNSTFQISWVFCLKTLKYYTEKLVFLRKSGSIMAAFWRYLPKFQFSHLQESLQTTTFKMPLE